MVTRQAFFDHSPLIGLANPLSPPVTIRVEDDHIDGRVTFGVGRFGEALIGGALRVLLELGGQALEGVGGVPQRFLRGGGGHEAVDHGAHPLRQPPLFAVARS